MSRPPRAHDPERFVRVRVSPGAIGSPLYAQQPIIEAVEAKLLRSEARVELLLAKVARLEARVEELEKPPEPVVLSTWKDIHACAVKHGGPKSMAWFVELVRTRRGPVYGMQNGAGRGVTVTAVESQLVLWMQGLRAPVGLLPVWQRAKGGDMRRRRKPAPSSGA